MLWGRDLLRMGLWWRVGDGRKIRVFDNLWLHSPVSFKLISAANTYNKDWYVSNLLNTENDVSIGCNASLLCSNFLDTDVEIIQSIPVGIRRCEDSLIWHYDGKGQYTAKFGYFRALENISMAFFHLRGVQYGISWSFECVLESFVGIILYIFCYLCGKSCLMMILSCLLWFSGLFGRIEMLMFMGRGSCNLQTSCKRQVCG